MPLRTAYKRCPNAVFLRVDMAAYQAESMRVKEILRRFYQVDRIAIDDHTIHPDADFARRSRGHNLEPVGATIQCVEQQILRKRESVPLFVGVGHFEALLLCADDSHMLGHVEHAFLFLLAAHKTLEMVGGADFVVLDNQPNERAEENDSDQDDGLSASHDPDCER